MRHVDMRACGAGQGERCCAFLVSDGDGPQCGRDDDVLRELLRVRALTGQMNARRLPDAMFPNCQLQPEGES